MRGERKWKGGDSPRDVVPNFRGFASAGSPVTPVDMQSTIPDPVEMHSRRRVESMMQSPVANSAPRVCVQGTRKGAEGSEVMELENPRVIGLGSAETLGETRMGYVSLSGGLRIHADREASMTMTEAPVTETMSGLRSMGKMGDASISTSAVSGNITTPPISTFASATQTPRELTSRNRQQTQSLGSRTMMMKDETVKVSRSSVMGYKPLIFDKIASFLDYHDQANLREAVFGEKDVDEDADLDKDADMDEDEDAALGEDAGMEDAGMEDAGMEDAGMEDAGMEDAGMENADMDEAQ